MGASRPFARVAVLVVLAGVCSVSAAGAHSSISSWFHPDHKATEDALIARALADPKAEFRAWMQLYDHHFTAQEEQRVFTSWKAAVQRMAEHNAQPDITWFMGIAERTGMGYATGYRTMEEHQGGQQPKQARRLAQHSTGYVPLKKGTQLPFSNVSSPVELRKNKCPSSLDWRSLGVVGPVRNQGLCGSSWAFSMIGAVETAFSIVLQDRNQETEFSAQAVLDCLANPGSLEKRGGCDGANPFLAGAEFVAAAQADDAGVIVLSDYPYVDFYTKQGSPAAAVNHQCQATAKTANLTVTSSYALADLNDELLELLVCHQPVTAAVSSVGPIQNYKGGVISPGNKCDDATPDQAVLVVGYTADYWIVKNSWGWQWGEDGYFRLSRNKTTSGNGVCNIFNQGGSFPIMKSSFIIPDPDFDPLFVRLDTSQQLHSTATETSTGAGAETSSIFPAETSSTTFLPDISFPAQFETSSNGIAPFLTEVSSSASTELSTSTGGAGSSSASGTCQPVYTIEKGDTLTTAAKKAGVSVQSLYDLTTLHGVMPLPLDATQPVVQQYLQLLQAGSLTLTQTQSLSINLPLKPGAVLLVPCTSDVPVYDKKIIQCTGSITIEVNDTLVTTVEAVTAVLQSSFNVSAASLANPASLGQALTIWNPQFKRSYTSAGDVLFIPPCRVSSEEETVVPDGRCVNFSYVVQEMDSLYSISNMFSCSIGDLLVRNPPLGSPKNPNVLLEEFVGQTITVARCPPSSRPLQLMTTSTMYNELAHSCQALAVITSEADFVTTEKFFNVTREEILHTGVNQDKHWKALTHGLMYWIPPCPGLAPTTNPKPTTTPSPATPNNSTTGVTNSTAPTASPSPSPTTIPNSHAGNETSSMGTTCYVPSVPQRTCFIEHGTTCDGSAAQTTFDSLVACCNHQIPILLGMGLQPVGACTQFSNATSTVG